MLSNAFSPFSPELTNSERVRQPRAIVYINDIPVKWIDVRINTTTFYMADSYQVRIPLSSQEAGFDLSYLSLQAEFLIEIWIGFPDNPDSYTTDDLQLMFVGECDEMSIDPLSMVATFTGRDLTSRLIDIKTYDKFPNMTASAIATNLANSAGLTPVVTPTQGNVGTLYNNQNVTLTKEVTQWDLLTYLAQQYNYVVYVVREELHFEPKPTPETSTPYILRYQPPNNQYESPIFNGMSLTMSRSLTVAKDVTVKVRVPYSPQSGEAHIATSDKTNTSLASKTKGKQTYVYTFPGLTPQQAKAKANSLLHDITLNEINIQCSLPGDNVLQKSSLVQLIGTGTRFDQNYFTAMVSRHIHYQDGYFMEVNAKNIDVNSQVTA